MGWRSRKLQAAEADLRESLLGSGLSPRLVNAICTAPQSVVHVDPRRPFREQGARGGEAYFVRSGVLATFRTSANGGRQILSLRFPGESIWPMGGALNHGLATIVRTEIIVLEAAALEKLVDEYPEFARYCLRSAQRHEAIGYEWLFNSGRRSSMERVAHLLCETAVRSGLGHENVSFSNPFTQQQIADITGQTSVNVCRVLGDLERDGVLRREAGKIEIEDWAELTRLGGFRPDYLTHPAGGGIRNS